jgi:hypothetical protein
MTGREHWHIRRADDRARSPVNEPTGVDAQVPLRVPGELPIVAAAVEQSWDGLRPVLRTRLSGELGTILMWWRDDNDPYRTRVLAFGEQAMCLAEPATRHGGEGHRLHIRRWQPGSVEEHGFHGPCSSTPMQRHGRAARHDSAAAVLTLPPEVSELLGHFPEEAQRYLQVPLLADGGAADGMRWYLIWDRPDQLTDAWLWLQAGRATTFAYGQRVLRGSGRTSTAHWDVRCWRARYAAPVG